MERVLHALDGLGQRGPVPDDVGGDALLGGATIVNQSEVPALGHVNAGVLVTMVGWLHPVTTLASPALIVPVIAALPGRPHLVASPREVERVFDVALAELADPAVFHEERWQVPGRIIPGSPDNSFAVRFFEVSGELIWGATARMISELVTIAVTGRNGL